MAEGDETPAKTMGCKGESMKGLRGPGKKREGGDRIKTFKKPVYVKRTLRGKD